MSKISTPPIVNFWELFYLFFGVNHLLIRISSKFLFFELVFQFVYYYYFLMFSENLSTIFSIWDKPPADIYNINYNRLICWFLFFLFFSRLVLFNSRFRNWSPCENISDWMFRTTGHCEIDTLKKKLVGARVSVWG